MVRHVLTFEPQKTRRVTVTVQTQDYNKLISNLFWLIAWNWIKSTEIILNYRYILAP